MNARFIRALLLASILLAISLGLTVRFEQQQRNELQRVTAFSNQDELWHSIALTKEYLQLRETAAFARSDASYYQQLRTRYDIFAGRVAAMQNGAFVHQLINRRTYSTHMAAINKMIADTDIRWAAHPISVQEISRLLSSLDQIQSDLLALGELIQHGFSDQLDENDKLVTQLGQTRITLAIFQSLLLLGFAGMALFELRRSLQRERQLLEAQTAAQAANEAKSRFLAHISHEMRTPLTSVLGYASQALKNPALGKESRQQLGQIRRSAEYLASLLGNVLDVSRIEAGHVQLNQETISLVELADDLLSLFALQTQEKGIDLSIELPPDQPLYLQLDASKLRQILINLIGNAVKFTQHGRILVQFTLIDEQDQLRLQVRINDSGPGIAADELDRLFSPFEQTASGRTAGGSGLGLVISREFARLMGGDVLCLHSSASGSIFQASVLAHAAPAIATTAAQQTTPVTLAGLAILVVEDQAINCELLCEVLRDASADVSAAADGQTAMNQIAGKHFDAIVLDFNLPDGDGLTLAQHIRSTRWQGRIVMLSAALSPSKDALAQAGVDHWLSKPFDSAHLITTLAGTAGLSCDTVQQPTLLAAQQAAAQLGYTSTRYREIAAKGLDRIDELLHEYMASDDSATRQRLAHSARGIALQIGAMALANVCDTIENMTVDDECIATLQNEATALLIQTKQALEQQRMQ